MRIYDFEGKKNISGERIREARLKLRLSQSDLAARVQVEGVTMERDSISRIEIGTRFIPDYEIPVFARLLVLSERVTRREIIIRIKDGRAETVVAALDRLERLYGAAFYRIFKTITVDNGSEFADADGIERSARRKDAKRTTVYYCHAYSSCERGTNENINRMIRRQFPKGTDFDKVTAAEVKRVETWLNDYPREILGFMSSAEAFEIAFDRAA